MPSIYLRLLTEPTVAKENLLNTPHFDSSHTLIGQKSVDTGDFLI